MTTTLPIYVDNADGYPPFSASPSFPNEAPVAPIGPAFPVYSTPTMPISSLPPSYPADSTSLDFYPSTYPQPYPSGASAEAGLAVGPMKPLEMTSSGGIRAPNSFEDEPPLLEELEIEPRKILDKSLAVTFMRKLSPEMQQDTDLAGPLLFCVLLGVLLLLQGKLHFGYVFGYGLAGCTLTFLMLNLMSAEGITFDRSTSILGYCMLPLVALAAVGVVANLAGVMGSALTWGAVGLCTFNATRFIEHALQMQHQRYLIAYPVALLYACFALMAVF